MSLKTKFFNSTKPGSDGYIPAFTMPELLVYMVIAGIIFLLVMEGFGLYGRYTQNRTDRIVANMGFYDGYHRLVSLCHAADSISSGFYDRISLYAEGKPECELTKEDSILIISRRGSIDTLFTNISDVIHREKDPGTRGADSLTVVLSGPDTRLKLSFAIHRRPEKEAVETIDAKEKDYTYE